MRKIPQCYRSREAEIVAERSVERHRDIQEVPRQMELPWIGV